MNERRIEGWVRGLDGLAIEGARVALFAGSSSEAEIPVELARSTTSSEGRFALAMAAVVSLESAAEPSSPEAVALRLTANAAGYLATELWLARDASGPIDVVLAPVASVLVRVVDAGEGKPLAGADVVLRVEDVARMASAEEPLVLRGPTDKLGEARFEVPSGGVYSAIVRAEGFLTGFAKALRERADLPYTCEMRLEHAPQLVGRVLRSVDGTPLEGVAIQDRERRTLARSRSDGSYSLAIDSTGFARLRYELEGWAPAELAARGEVLQSGTLPDVLLERGASLTGSWRSGAPEQVELRADRRTDMGIARGTWSLAAKARDAESFRFEGVPPKQNCELWITTQELPPVAALLRALENGEDYHMKALALEGIHTIELEVLGLGPGDGARVTCKIVPRFREADARVLEALESSVSFRWPAGLLRLQRRLPSGMVRFEARSMSGRRAKAELALRGAAGRASCTLQFEPLAQIRGRIAAEDGSSVGEVGVRLSQHRGDYYAVGRCSIDGSFTLEVLPEGEYSLELFALEQSRNDLGIAGVRQSHLSPGRELHLLLPVLDGTIRGVLRCGAEDRHLLSWTWVVATDARMRRFEARLDPNGGFELRVPRRESFTVRTAIAMPPTQVQSVDPKSWPAMVSRDGVTASSETLVLEWTRPPR